MKKPIFIILLLILSNLDLSSQEQYIILSGGLTKPVSDFADDNFDNKNAGFATNGYNFGFELAHFFNPWFGFGGSFKFNNAGFDSQKFNDLLEQKYINQYDTVHLSSGDYNLHNFLAGPYGKINIGNHISIFGKAFIGVLSTFRPDQTLIYREYGGLDQQGAFLEGKLKASFAWNFGAGILIKVNDRFGIITKADYIGANPNFEKFDYLTIELIEDKRPVRYLNLNIGIALSM